MLQEGKIGRSEIGEQWQIDMELNLKLALNLAANARTTEAKRYLATLRQDLYTLMHDRLGADPARIGGGKVGITFVFGMVRPVGGSSHITKGTLELFLKEQYEYVVMRSRMTTSDTIMMEFAFLTTIIKYLSSFPTERIFL